MSKPVDQISDHGPGRFWELYGTAGTDRDRPRAAPDAGDTPPQEGDPPPQGDTPPGSGLGPHPPDGHACLEWCPICRGAEVLRSGAPPEIRGQLQAVQRDSLMMLRALIDGYLQRPPGEQPSEADGVEDIPIR